MKRIIALFLSIWLLAPFGGWKLLAQQQPKPLNWPFPINRPHTGILLGNGTQGLMVWGGGRQLNITIGRAGFWDHRGGNEFSAKTTFADVKRMLQAGDYAGVKTAFAIPKNGDQGFGRPQQLGGGRLELTLPLGWELKQGVLDMAKGEITVRATMGDTMHKITINQATNNEEAKVDLPPALSGKIKARLVPAWEQTQAQLKRVGIAQPTSSTSATRLVFTQPLPNDAGLVVDCQIEPTRLVIRTALTGKAIDGPTVLPPLPDYSARFWKDYWASVPYIQLPDPVLQEIVDYGLYKQACVTSPQGVAATLQGPFMEDYQVVPWSNDYHFNINAEMIYWPALATNRLSHFGPLWAMLKGWMPTLKQNGESFFNRQGALMLPHAVDDRCRVVGTFWSGTIDHACTAWMAQMAWQHYRYGLDQPDAKAVLTDVAWPLLVGAFEGYYAMLEEIPDSTTGGKRFSLPISVSAEYGGDGPNAWGRDASFQLAALHRICRTLPQAAAVLGRPIDPRWADVDTRLPPYTTITGVWMPEFGQSNERIGLWQGADLPGSHRHHSHLAGIYPFATIDLNSPAQRKIVDNSLTTWRFRGAGAWTGWCVPWASILLSRTGQTEAAISWLHYWKDNFTNEGRGTLHNANNGGSSIFGAPDWTKEEKSREIMQLDGGFGALNAVLELLVQSRDEGIYVLPDRPRQWRDLRFDNLRTDGAFQVGATLTDGRVRQVRVKSLAGGKLRLVLPTGYSYQVNGEIQKTARIERDTKPGEVLTFSTL